MDATKLDMEEKVEIRTTKTEEITPDNLDQDVSEPLENETTGSTGEGGTPEQENPNTSAMGKPTGLFEQLGNQYDNHERATPDGGSLAASLEPEIKKIESSVDFHVTDSDGFEQNVKVGALGGNGGVDLNEIETASTPEHDALVQRDQAINRKEITHIDNQEKVLDFEAEQQGQTDDGKGLLSSGTNKNGAGEPVNPSETHVLNAHGGVNCKVEENYTEETGDLEGNGSTSNDAFNSGDLMTPKSGSAPAGEPDLAPAGEVADEEVGEDEEVPTARNRALDDEEDFEDGKESEDEIPNDLEEGGDDAVDSNPEDNEVSTEPTDTETEFADENVDPMDGDEIGDGASVGGDYTVTRIPGIADDEGCGDDLSEKKDNLEAPHYEEHGVFDGSDQAANVNTNGENGTDEAVTPEHSQKESSDIEPNYGEKQENSGNMGSDLEGFGVPKDRDESCDEPITTDGFDDENVDPETNDDEINAEPVETEETTEEDVEEEPIDNKQEAVESYKGHYNDAYAHYYQAGFESHEVDVIKLVDDLVD